MTIQRPVWPAGPLGSPPFRVRTATFVRRHKLAPYLLLLPAFAGIALVLLWPLIQVALYSFQNYGLPQITGAMPTQWVGLANFDTILHDSEFWLSLRTTVLFALVAVPITLVVGTSAKADLAPTFDRRDNLNLLYWRHHGHAYAIVGAADIGYLWNIYNDIAWQFDAI